MNTQQETQATGYTFYEDVLETVKPSDLLDRIAHNIKDMGTQDEFPEFYRHRMYKITVIVEKV